MQAGQAAPPKVFISYSHDSPEHQDRVLALANRLRADGIDAVVDQYDQAPKEGWPRWAERRIAEADFVLLMCTETYLRRVEGRDVPGVGRGVIWEANLIYNHIYAATETAAKFVPVVLNDGGESFIPAAIRCATYFNLAAENGYEQLYRHITNQPLHDVPELGTLRSLRAPQPRSYPASFTDGGRRSPTEAVAERTRRKMLARVHHDWIQGVLERSLHGVSRIELVVESRPAAVAERFRVAIETPGCAPTILDNSKNIADIFDGHVGALLILGEPGAGKTTLLLELARMLLTRAEQDSTLPMPVVFNLSSWSVRRQKFAAWLVDELNERYDVPRRMAQEWVDGGEVVPLLDGLDEVAGDDREACAAAINEFRRENGLLPIAVCSRTAEYEHLTKRLRMSGAVVIQPLNRYQVKNYLDTAGERLRALREAATRDPAILDFLQSPLTVDVARMAFDAAPDQTLSDLKSAGRNRGNLVGRYVDVAFRRRGDESQYSRERAVRWMSRLAESMTRNSQTTFHLEILRPEWLRSGQQQEFARTANWIAIALLGAAGYALSDMAFVALFGDVRFWRTGDYTDQYAAIFQAVFNPLNPLITGAYGACMAVVAAFTTGRTVTSGRWSWPHVQRAARNGLGSGFTIGARLGVVVGVLTGPLMAFSLPELGDFGVRLVIAPVLTIIVAALDLLSFALVGGISGVLFGCLVAFGFGDKFDPGVLKAEWSSGAVWRTTKRGTRLGLIAGAFLGTIAAAVAAVVNPGELAAMAVALRIAGTLLNIIIAALVFGLVGAVLGAAWGALIGLAFVAPAVASFRSLLPELRQSAGSTRIIRPVDRVRWSWRNRRTGLHGMIQFATLGAIPGIVVMAPLNAVAAALMPFLNNTVPTPFGSLDVTASGFVDKLAISVELFVTSGLVGALLGGLLSAVWLGPLGFIEGMLVRTDLETRPNPNQGTIRSLRAALLSSALVGFAFAAIGIPLGLLQEAIAGGARSAVTISRDQSIIIYALAGAQLGMLFAFVRNGGLFCVQHVIMRLICWWSGAAPLRYTAFLDYAAGQLGLLHKVGGGYIFVHRYVMEYLAEQQPEGAPGSQTRAAVQSG